MTSGKSPDAADDVRTWLNRWAGTLTRSTVTPEAEANFSSIPLVLARRSGRVSAVQTVIPWGSDASGGGPFGPPLDVQEVRIPAAKETAATKPTLARPLVLFTPVLLPWRCPQIGVRKSHGCDRGFIKRLVSSVSK
jgi:hypothetical protein